MVVSPLTGEVLCNEGDKISEELAYVIENNGVSVMHVKKEDGTVVRVVSNGMVDSKVITGLELDEEGINEKVSILLY